MSQKKTSLLKAVLIGDFSRLVTLKVIQIIYLLGLYGGILVSLVGWIGAAQSGEVPGVMVLFGWPISSLVWVVFWRMLNEWAVAIFQIAENTSDFVKLVRKHEVPTPPELDEE